MSDDSTAKPAGGRPRRPSGLSAARLLAVQALYQRAVSGQSAAEVLREFLQHRVEEEVEGLKHAKVSRELLGELVEGVAKEEGTLDDMLAAVLDEDWTLDRVELLLRVLLRAAIFELSETARLVVTIVGAATLIAGALIGTAKDDIKKALAGSTMSQIGYMHLAAGLGKAGYVFAIAHLIAHPYTPPNSNYRLAATRLKNALARANANQIWQ